MKTLVRTAAAKTTLVRTAVLSTMLMTVGLGAALADPTEKKGTTPYVTHFIFRPVQSLEVTGLEQISINFTHSQRA